MIVTFYGAAAQYGIPYTSRNVGTKQVRYRIYGTGTSVLITTPADMDRKITTFASATQKVTLSQQHNPCTSAGQQNAIGVSSDGPL
jgi:hypothetical protein